MSVFLRNTLAGMIASLVVLVAFGLAGKQPTMPRVDSGAEWPEAERLFRRSPRWMGGENACSVRLGKERSLWLFGDSFIATTHPGNRSGATMVRNTVAIQLGDDPAHASLEFYWRTKAGKPADFFPGEGRVWLWPGHGVRLENTLLVFCTRVRPAKEKNGLGFENFGWTAFLVDNPDSEPSAWKLRRVAAPRNPWRIIAGAAALVQGEFLHVFAPREPSHDVYLARWRVSEAARGNLLEAAWWCGPERGWVRQSQLQEPPTPVLTDGAMEFSVHFDARLRRYVLVQTTGFGAATIELRWAARLEGPWSSPVRVYRPPESDRRGALVYAGRAHPELAGADLVVTYASNHEDFRTLVEDTSLYYPRFVRVNFASR